MRRLTTAMLALALAAVAGSAGAQTLVTSDVTSDTSWGPTGSGADVISPVLDRPIFVKDGATLTILAGTVVRGQPRTDTVQAGVVTGTPGALVVTRSGRIDASGAQNNPIIFTTAAVDNDDDGVADDANGDDFSDAWQPGDTFLDDDPLNAPLAPLNTQGGENLSLWGAVVLSGNAPTNLDDSGGVQNPIGVDWGVTTHEGLTIPGFDTADAAYGGDQPHDSSGVFRYVSIRHGGDEIGENNELNCLSLGGVGDATVIENVECYVNFDDGFEWFGGTVDGKNLVAAMIGDDSFDLDQGYTGVNQFLFAAMPFFDQANGDAFGSGSGDKAGEWDGDDSPNAGMDFAPASGNSDNESRCTPFPNPSMWNMTVVGSTAPAGSDAPQTNADNLGIQMRNGFAGELYNSLVVNTGSAQGLQIDTTDRNDNTNCSDTIDHVNQGLVSVAASSFDGVAAMTGAENTALSNGNAIASLRGGGNNFVNSPLFTGLVNEDVTFDPTGDAAGKLVPSLKSSPADPRPQIEAGVFNPVPATGNRVDDAAFRGAFEPGRQLWTAGWTVLDRAGLMVSN